MSSLIIPSADLIRVLTPSTAFNEKAGPGLPARLGRMESFLEAANIPDLAKLGDDKTPETIAFDNKVEEEFFTKLYSIIPKEAISNLDYDLEDYCINFGDQYETTVPHLDGQHYASYSYTVVAGFPNATVSYPEYPTEKCHAYKQAKVIDVDPSLAVPGIPADIAIFNDDRLLHAAPGNNLTIPEWQEFFKNYPDHANFLQEDGSIRRLFARAYIKIDKEWVDTVCAAAPVAAFEMA